MSQFKKKQEDYNVWKLIDHRIIDQKYRSSSLTHIICDIDKTYLETEFETFAKIAKIAFESADEKKTVKGATEVLLAARWGELDSLEQIENYPHDLHFVSSSPPQLRSVLEEKLALDGLDWTTDTFKNQAYNIKKGRFDLLRHQTAYKSAAILTIISRFKNNSTIYMIGDNAEADAEIYLGIKLFCEKIFTADQYIRYLKKVGIENDIANEIVEKFISLPQIKVEGIFIRKIKEKEYDNIILKEYITEFKNFFEVGVIFLLKNIIPASILWELVRKFHNNYDISLIEIKNCLIELTSGKLVNQNLQKEIEKILIHIHSTINEFDFSAPNEELNFKEKSGDKILSYFET